MKLNEVIEGLRAGQAFERPLAGDSGKERLSPAGDGEFRHDVAGEAHDGWGGSSAMPISTLSNGRWPADGWVRSSIK